MTDDFLKLATGYIDPNTMHHVFTFFGPMLAFFAAGAGIFVSIFFFFRHHLAKWFRRLIWKK